MFQRTFLSRVSQRKFEITLEISGKTRNLVSQKCGHPVKTLVSDFLKLGMFNFIQKSFIERCPLIPLRRNNLFHRPSKNYFPALQSFSLAWSSHVTFLKVRK